MRTLSSWKVETKQLLEDGKEELCTVRIKSDDGKQAFCLSNCFPVEGLVLPGIFVQSRQRYDWLRNNIKLRKEDVVVCTYPKCGTTWCENILVLLLNGIDANFQPLSKNTFEPSTGVGKIWPSANVWEDPEHTTLPRKEGELKLRMTRGQFDAVSGRRLIKSHMPYHMFLGSDPCTNELPDTKIVVVARSPKDACVSAYHHFLPHAPFDAYCKAWLKGSVYWGSWFDHTRVWYQEAMKNDNILFITYEDMKADPVSSVARIAQHVGVEADRETCEAIAAKSSFKNMKKMAVDAETAGGSGSSIHLRAGRVGGWSEHFTEQTANEFDVASSCLEGDLGTAMRKNLEKGKPIGNIQATLQQSRQVKD